MNDYNGVYTYQFLSLPSCRPLHCWKYHPLPEITVCKKQTPPLSFSLAKLLWPPCGWWLECYCASCASVRTYTQTCFKRIIVLKGLFCQEPSCSWTTVLITNAKTYHCPLQHFIDKLLTIWKIFPSRQKVKHWTRELIGEKVVFDMCGK